MKTLFDYTLNSLGRFGSKNIATGVLFTLLVWLLSSALMMSHALKYLFLENATSLPDITLIQLQGGRPSLIQERDFEPFWAIPGVSMVQGRVWGRTHLEMGDLHVTIVAVEPYVENYDLLTSTFAKEIPNAPAFLTSQKLLQALNPYRSKDQVSFLRHGGGFEALQIGGVFDESFSLLGEDIILMPMAQARAILGIPSGYTDVFIRVPNETEVPTVARKIKEHNPTLHVQTKEQMIQGYLRLYDYKSGWFLGLFLICFATFAMILYDKASGISAQERKEIGLLKALGWETHHILRHKLTEASIISIGGFLTGFSLAIWYVFGLDAPLLGSLFRGYGFLENTFSFPFSINVSLFALLFFATVPLYVATCIVPAWKASIEEAGEVMR